MWDAMEGYTKTSRSPLSSSSTSSTPLCLPWRGCFLWENVGFLPSAQRSFFSTPMSWRLLTRRGPARLRSRERFIMRNGLSAAAGSQQHKRVVCRNNRETRGGRERLAVSGRVKIWGAEVRGSVGLKTRPECNAIAP